MLFGFSNAAYIFFIFQLCIFVFFDFCIILYLDFTISHFLQFCIFQPFDFSISQLFSISRFLYFPYWVPFSGHWLLYLFEGSFHGSFGNMLPYFSSYKRQVYYFTIFLPKKFRLTILIHFFLQKTGICTIFTTFLLTEDRFKSLAILSFYKKQVKYFY